jgi:hypothetical protein
VTFVSVVCVGLFWHYMGLFDTLKCPGIFTLSSLCIVTFVSDVCVGLFWHYMGLFDTLKCPSIFSLWSLCIVTFVPVVCVGLFWHYMGLFWHSTGLLSLYGDCSGFYTGCVSVVCVGLFWHHGSPLTLWVSFDTMGLFCLCMETVQVSVLVLCHLGEHALQFRLACRTYLV